MDVRLLGLCVKVLERRAKLWWPRQQMNKAGRPMQSLTYRTCWSSRIGSTASSTPSPTTSSLSKLYLVTSSTSWTWTRGAPSLVPFDDKLKKGVKACLMLVEQVLDKSMIFRFLQEKDALGRITWETLGPQEVVEPEVGQMTARRWWSPQAEVSVDVSSLPKLEGMLRTSWPILHLTQLWSMRCRSLLQESKNHWMVDLLLLGQRYRPGSGQGTECFPFPISTCLRNLLPRLLMCSKEFYPAKHRIWPYSQVLRDSWCLNALFRKRRRWRDEAMTSGQG